MPRDAHCTVRVPRLLLAPHAQLASCVSLEARVQPRNRACLGKCHENSTVTLTSSSFPLDALAKG